MDPNPSRIPRRISVHPSSSSPLTGRQLYGSGRTGLTDTYRTGEESLKLESEFQDSDTLRASHRDWGFEETESHDSSWKRSTVPLHSGSIERPWSGNLLGSRLLPASTSFQSDVNCESERTPGVHSRLHNQQQDRDSKRPKLSYSGCSSVSGVRTNSSGLNVISDSSWRYDQVPRSSLVLGPYDSELMGERRAQERRIDPSSSAFVDYSQRNGNMTASSYLQDRADTSNAQGARPKESVLAPVRLNSSTNHPMPLEHQSSFFTRDSERSSQRPSTSREMGYPQRSAQSEYTHSVNRDGFADSTTERPPVQQTSEAPTDTEGRRTTRQLLSRIASSMSSTFFSRRSSHESMNSRVLDSEDARIGPRVQNPTPSSLNAVSTPNATDGTSEPSQGFGFLRRRRWCLPTGSSNRSADSDTGRYRSEDTETRTTSSWLSSSFRNRCTPLFSRRRREGRDETARSTSDPASRLYPLRRESREVNSSIEAAQHLNGAASRAPPGLHPFFRRESRVAGPSVELAENLSGASSVSSPVLERANTSAATSILDPSQTRRNTGRSGILTGSFFHFAVPPGLGSSSNNVMITVDVLSSGRSSADGHEAKPQSSGRDPEKLKKIKESLLLEDSEDDEGDLCRICQMGASTSTNPLIEPCRCTGSLQYIHQECMKKWLQAKINSGSRLEAVTTCELCKEKLQLDLMDFDVRELYRTHHSERVDYEFLSSGLYLVVLLHLCEQRFTNLLGAANEASTRDRFTSLARTLQAHLADLETSEEDSEGDGES